MSPHMVLFSTYDRLRTAMSWITPAEGRVNFASQELVAPDGGRTVYRVLGSSHDLRRLAGYQVDQLHVGSDIDPQLLAVAVARLRPSAVTPV